MALVASVNGKPVWEFRCSSAVVYFIYLLSFDFYQLKCLSALYMCVFLQKTSGAIVTNEDRGVIIDRINPPEFHHPSHRPLILLQNL